MTEYMISDNAIVQDEFELNGEENSEWMSTKSGLRYRPWLLSNIISFLIFIEFNQLQIYH